MKVIRVPAGIEPQAYWDNLIAKIVNDKYCSLRANLKSGMLQTYKGNYLCCACERKLINAHIICSSYHIYQHR